MNLKNSLKKLKEEVREELREYASKARIEGQRLFLEGRFKRGKEAYRLAVFFDRLADELAR